MKRLGIAIMLSGIFVCGIQGHWSNLYSEEINDERVSYDYYETNSYEEVQESKPIYEETTQEVKQVEEYSQGDSTYTEVFQEENIRQQEEYRRQEAQRQEEIRIEEERRRQEAQRQEEIRIEEERRRQEEQQLQEEIRRQEEQQKINEEISLIQSAIVSALSSLENNHLVSGIITTNIVGGKNIIITTNGTEKENWLLVNHITLNTNIQGHKIKEHKFEFNGTNVTNIY